MFRKINSRASRGTTGGNTAFTAVYIKVPEGYVGFVEELPGANTQGTSLAKTRESLREAVELVLEANRDLAEEGH